MNVILCTLNIANKYCNFIGKKILVKKNLMKLLLWKIKFMF